MLSEREAAIQLNNIIEQKVKEILKEKDYTIYCEVKAVNENGRLDLVPLDSENLHNVLANKVNNSPFSFKSGDIALLYVPKGQLSSSFVVAKMNISQTELQNYLNSDILAQIKNAISQVNISGSGQVGPQGPQGATPNIQIGWVTCDTLEPSETASVEVSTTQSGADVVFDWAFSIPKGKTGMVGPQGPAGTGGEVDIMGTPDVGVLPTYEADLGRICIEQDRNGNEQMYVKKLNFQKTQRITNKNQQGNLIFEGLPEFSTGDIVGIYCQPTLDSQFNPVVVKQIEIELAAPGLYYVSSFPSDISFNDAPYQVYLVGISWQPANNSPLIVTIEDSDTATSLACDTTYEEIVQAVEKNRRIVVKYTNSNINYGEPTFYENGDLGILYGARQFSFIINYYSKILYVIFQTDTAHPGNSISYSVSRKNL